MTTMSAKTSPRSPEDDGDRFQVVPLNDGPCPPQLLEGALKLYATAFDPDVITDPNELIAVKDKYNSLYKADGDKFYLYALTDTAHNNAIGFAMIAAFRKQRVALADYIVIEKKCREGVNAYTAFRDGIRRHLESRIRVDYLAVEFVFLNEKDERNTDQNRVIHLFLFNKFQIVEFPYQSLPMYTNSLDQLNVFDPLNVRLLVYCNRSDHTTTLSITDLRKIINCIALWYDRWEEFISSGASLRKFKAQLNRVKAYNRQQMVGLDHVNLSTRLGYVPIPRPEGPRVFLSYAHVDRETVAAVDQWLRNQGARVDLDERELIAGRDIRDEIIRLIQQAGKVVCFYSSASSNRYYTTFERRLSEEAELRSHEQGSKRVLLLYFRIDDTPLPPESTHRLAINAWTMSFERACRELWRHILLSHPLIFEAP